MQGNSKDRGMRVSAGRIRMDEKKVERKREKEKQTMAAMMEIYCHGVHKQPLHRLCGECRELLAYAALRTDRCPFMATKIFCSACRVHCYTREKQEKIRAVMRYAGPRMLLIHPGQALRHVWVTLRSKAAPGEKS